MNNVIWCIVISLMMLVFSIYITLTVPSMPTGTDWIDARIETGQDRFGNCYLYIKPWQWVDRVECDRIGKPVDKFGNSL
jgi:hypothetical protein